LRPNAYVEAYVQAQLTQFLVLHEEGPNDVRDTEFAGGEAYVRLTAPSVGLSLQLGRQSCEDRRRGLYDADLDAVRAHYRAAPLALELSASREALVDKDLLNPDEEESIDNYILHATYDLGDDLAIGGYGILRDPGDGDRSIFLGLFSVGTLGERLAYWLDAAQVRGEEDGRELRGYGLDLLATYHLDAPFAPHAILGYAYGSGDADPDDDRDGSFRQTGLQGNETEVGGLTPFSYYGETFDPELSNLSIFTLGLGARPTPRLSVDLNYHYYLQNEAADQLRGAAIDAEPSGRNRQLGSELDLVLGFEEEGDFRIRGFLGYFVPGRAFERSDDALFVIIEAQYEF
jgi:alginate production protein